MVIWLAVVLFVCALYCLCCWVLDLVIWRFDMVCLFCVCFDSNDFSGWVTCCWLVKLVLLIVWYEPVCFTVVVGFGGYLVFRRCVCSFSYAAGSFFACCVCLVWFGFALILGLRISDLVFGLLLLLFWFPWFVDLVCVLFACLVFVLCYLRMIVFWVVWCLFAVFVTLVLLCSALFDCGCLICGFVVLWLFCFNLCCLL